MFRRKEVEVIVLEEEEEEDDDVLMMKMMKKKRMNKKKFVSILLYQGDKYAITPRSLNLSVSLKLYKV